MKAEVLECCAIKVSTGDETYRYIDRFKSKRFFKKKLSDGRKIKKEIVLVALCLHCKHYILKYLWYTKTTAGFHDWSESQIKRGKRADGIFKRYNADFTLQSLSNPCEGEKQIKHSKNIPLIYFKAASGDEQLPRYVDESDDAGRKFYNPAKTFSL